MSKPDHNAASARILVVEDSSVFREMQQLLLGQAGYVVSAHAEPQSALEIAAQEHFDLVVIDYELPQMNGQLFMHALRKTQPDIAVIFVSGSLTLELAIQLSGEGVAGIFNKPANPKTLLEKVNETLARNAARDTAARVGSNNPLGGRTGSHSAALLPATAAEPASDQLAFVPRSLPGSSPALREFTHRIWKVRDFRSVLLLQGEPGSPFASLARDLAEISIFCEGPLMVCHAAEFEARRLIEVLAPSLLSHDAGTLIVDGVENFTTEQQEMLHNLMSGRDIFLPFARRFRLVLAATDRLSSRVDDGTFDETLYYKISSLTVPVPSLRDLRGDIGEIARTILAHPHGDEGPASGLHFAPDAAAWLEMQDWPGNYHQLHQTVLDAIPRAQRGLIARSALKDPLPGGAAKPPHESLATPARAEIASRSIGNARPPFPLSSDLAADAAGRPGKAPEPAKPATVPSPPKAVPTSAAAAVAKAPAGQLFGRVAAAPVQTPAVQSRFRPASASYQFTKRLAECLALVDSETAG